MDLIEDKARVGVIAIAGVEKSTGAIQNDHDSGNDR